MISISDRLLAIADFINNGERVADIGTDHAYLPIYLRQTEKSPHVLACDIKMSPLKSAIKNVKDCHTDGIDFRLCDGLSGISPDEADTFVIAGRGGECIAGILDRSGCALGSQKKFILQPMNSPEELRKFLFPNFTLVSERAVTDAGRTYTVMLVYGKEDGTSKDDGFIFTGLLDPKKDADRVFLQKQYNRLFSCAESIKSIEDKRQEYEYYSSACKAIEKRLKKV